MTQARRTASGMLTATGERLIPELQQGELVHAEHLARYRLAARFARDRRVLDAACGEGYGAGILAAAGAKSVTGVDIDPVTVAHARQRYGLQFERADIAELPYPDDGFDLVVSFETIEHVRDAARVLEEYRRVLSDGGTLIVSTPNTNEYLVDNEFHAHEYTHDEFVALLAHRFLSVQVLLQHNWLASTVTSDEIAADAGGERSHELDFYKLVGIQGGEELYTVAICGSAPQPAPRGIAVTAGIDEAHRHAVALQAASENAEQWRLQFLEAEQTAHHWHGEYETMRDRARELSGAYEDAIAELEIAYRSTSWRVTSPLRKVAEVLRARNG